MRSPGRAARCAALAVPVAEGAREEAPPDNRVDFRRFAPAPRVPMEPPGNGPSRIVEETFRWNGIPSTGPVSGISVARDTLQLTALWAAVALVGFHVFRTLLQWAGG